MRCAHNKRNRILEECGLNQDSEVKAGFTMAQSQSSFAITGRLKIHLKQCAGNPT